MKDLSFESSLATARNLSFSEKLSKDTVEAKLIIAGSGISEYFILLTNNDSLAFLWNFGVD